MIHPEKMKFLELAIEFYKGRDGIDPSEVFMLANEFAAYTKPDQSPATNTASDFKSYLKSTICSNPMIKGRHVFTPHDYQNNLADAIEGNEKVMICHARQMGITTILLNYAWYFAVKNPNSTVVFLNHSGHMISESMDRMVANNIQSSESKLVKHDKRCFGFENGSEITFTSALSDPVNGKTISLLIVDNMAFIPPVTLASLYPCISEKNGRVVIASSIGRHANEFQKMFQSSEPDDYLRVTALWSLHPDRDEAWATAIKKQIGEKAFNAEFGCQFPAKE